MSGEISRINGQKGGRPPMRPDFRRGVNVLQLIENDEAPLQIMIHNMLFHHRQAQFLGERLSELLDTPDVDAKECLKVAGHLIAARENSQKCAVDAAPYCHPRLNAIAFSGEMNHTGEVHQIDEKTASPGEAADAWSEMVSV